MHRIACVVACVLATGCSFIGVRGPPTSRPKPGAALDCSDSYAGPVADTVGVAVLGGLAAHELVWYAHNPNAEFRGADGLAASALVLVGLVYVMSAASGYQDVAACRAARSDPPRPPPDPHDVNDLDTARPTGR